MEEFWKWYYDEGWIAFTIAAFPLGLVLGRFPKLVCFIFIAWLIFGFVGLYYIN